MYMSIFMGFCGRCCMQMSCVIGDQCTNTSIKKFRVFKTTAKLGVQ